MSGSIELKVLESFDQAKQYSEAWDDLVRQSGADVYQTYDWSRIWWSHYGEGRRLRIVLGFAGGRLVGVMPIFLEVLWFGPVRLCLGKLVGADYSLQLCNLLIEQESGLQFLRQAFRKFFADKLFDVLLIGPVSGPGARVGDIVDSAASQNDVIGAARIRTSGCATRFDLPDCFEDYLKEIGGNQRRDYNKKMRRLSALGSVTTDVVIAPDDLRTEFGKFVEQHELQWRREGKRGHFGDWPSALEFNQDLLECFSQQQRVGIYRILVDGKVMTRQYCFSFGRVRCWRLPAREAGAELESVSLGKISLVNLFEAAIGEKIRVVEGGRGHYDYKTHLGAKEWPLQTIEIIGPQWQVRLRVAIFRGLARCLNLLYYRIDFLKIAPRVPFVRHTLWEFWIRRVW